jgi:hypothetical protein
MKTLLTSIKRAVKGRYYPIMTLLFGIYWRDVSVEVSHIWAATLLIVWMLSEILIEVKEVAARTS